MYKIETINDIPVCDAEAREEISQLAETVSNLSQNKADKTDLTSPFNFKGSTTYSALPTSGNTINDTYYCTDLKRRYTWNGTAWYPSSLDESEYTDELNQLSKEIDGLGAMKRYNHNGGKVFSIVDTHISLGDTIYFRPISANEENKGLYLFGIYGEDMNDGYDKLVESGFGTTNKVVSTREYHHIQVASIEYISTEFVFDYLQTHTEGIQGDIFKLQESVKENKKEIDIISSATKNLGVARAGNFFSEVSKSCVDFYEIEQGKTYKIIVHNIKNAFNDRNPLVYVFKKDGTYTNLEYSGVNVDGTVIYDNVLTDSDTEFIRIYLNKDPDAEYCACDWTIYKKDGNRIDTLEKEVLELNRVNQLMHSNNLKTCSIFNRVCCVGDSYTSGHISTDTGTYPTNENYAYPSFMGRLTGNDYFNCGCSGCNVVTWQTHERGLPKAQSIGKVQAYLIGLGLNDAAVGTTREVPLGTIDDIGTEAQTYYGGLSKIIRELKAISPNAMIFVQTIPNPNEVRLLYNEAIRNVVNTYKDTYDTHLLDLYEYRDMYTNSSLTGDAIGGHYTAIGYQQFAEILCKIWSDYINNNISKFQNVHLIDYDE